jgi:anti-anti-sigma factor
MIEDMTDVRDAGGGAIVDLILTENTVDSVVIVEVRGEVDVQSAPQLHDRLTEVIDKGNKSVVVDLTRMAFIDSTGLGTLVAVLNHTGAPSRRCGWRARPSGC